MDDIDDDARYSPNTYPSNPRRHHLPSSASASLHRSRPSNRLAPHPPPPNHLARPYPDEDEEDEEEEEEDEPDNMDQPLDDEEEDDVRAAQIRGGGADVDGDNGEDGDSSFESRGKRRRIDKFAHGFEFVPRAAPVPAASAPSKIPPPPRTLPADWSEDSTFVLLEAWGERYIQNGRKSLRSEEWSEVSKIVSQAARFPRSDAQCRNRLDTLKKKYKKEKARLGEHGNSSSIWVYFKKMDALMSSPSPPPSGGRRQQQQPPRLPCGVDAGEYVFTGSSFNSNRVNGNDEMRDSPGDTETEDDGDDEEEEDESDGLPPRSDGMFQNSGSSFRMLADSIQKFGKIYEKMENNKRQQMAELERMRKDFQRDLEVQKRQILERAQAEIARIREEDAGYEEEEDRLDEDDDDDDNDDGDGGGGGSAENLSG